jgi:hypothetical protein
MKSLKKIYRDFFGLTEQAAPAAAGKATGAVKMPKATPPADIKKMTDQGINVKLEGELEEAQLVNNLIDYRGGVEYVLRDPSMAEQTAQEIQEWAERKGFTVIKKIISPSKAVGYFYFRLGQDPAIESQKLQGYLAQKPELKHFRFNVRNSKPTKKI